MGALALGDSAELAEGTCTCPFTVALEGTMEICGCAEAELVAKL